MAGRTDFATLLRRFLTHHLPSVRGCSPGTVDSYRQAFCLLLEYLRSEHGLEADEVELDDITRVAVEGFLDWLEARGCAASTRNQRKAAIDSFVRFLEYERPECLPECRQILSIPPKRTAQKEIPFLKTEAMRALLGSIDTGRRDGLRDHAMLSVMYATGVRVSELTGLRARDVSLGEPPTLLVHGKGNKARYVPLVGQVTQILRTYMRAYGLDLPERNEEWLFQSHAGQRLTRQGVTYILRKHADTARMEHPESGIPERLSPHGLRHTAAMEMVGAGVDLIYIRDVLGHASVRTTEIYARADSKLRRKAIEAVDRAIVPPENPVWEEDDGLREWLNSLGRRR